MCRLHARAASLVSVAGITIAETGGDGIYVYNATDVVLRDVYGTFRLNFDRFDRFELDLRGHTQP